MASVNIYKSQVENVIKAIKSANLNVTGPSGCGHELETVLKTLGTYWKSERAVSFAQAACKDLNATLRDVNKALSSYVTGIAKNANQWWESEKSAERVDTSGASALYVASTSRVSEIEVGKGGTSGETVIPTSAEAKAITSSYRKIRDIMSAAFRSMRQIVNENPNAFYGAGQSELQSSLASLSSASIKCLLEIQKSFIKAMNDVGVTTDENVETSKKNLSISSN